MLTMNEISMDEIVPGKLNSRTNLGDLTELTNSIQAIGVKQPILVRETEEFFEVFAGFRRFEASKLANRTTIPAVVYPKDLPEEEMFAINLVENIQRQDLNVVDEARGYEELKKIHGFTNKQIADKIGMSVSRVRERLGVLKMSDITQEALYQGRISLKSAKEIERLPVELRAKYVKMAEDLQGERFEKMVDKEIVKLEKNLNKDDKDKEPTQEELDKKELTAVVRRVKTALAPFGEMVDPEDYNRLKELNWRVLGENDIDDLRAVVNLLTVLGESAPQDIEINEKAKEEVVATVEARLLVLDLDNPEVRQGLIQMILQIAKQRAIEKAQFTGKRPRISYVLIKEVLDQFYLSRRDVAGLSTNSGK